MKTWGTMVLLAVVSMLGCGGSGGDGASVLVQQPPGTTICETTVSAETGQPLNIFCDSDGNVVGQGPVTQGSNNLPPAPTPVG